MNYRESLLWLYAAGLQPYDVIEFVKHFPEPHEILGDSSRFSRLESVNLRDGIKQKVIRGPSEERLGTLRRAIDRNRIDVILPGEPGYPPLLKEIRQPPPVLFSRGALNCGNNLCAAIVGTRKCSSYGRRVASFFSEELTSVGITVVSGMALGIDSVAHQAALNFGGDTVAVLGCGPDVIYPATSGRLFRRILESGRIVTEFPPGTPPMKHHFPLRNRIISGFSRCVIVIEAGERSGALITAGTAADQGRDVYTVPGNIFSAGSLGTLSLLDDGAIPAVSTGRIIRETFPDLAAVSNKQIILNEVESNVYKCLSREGVHFDSILNRTELDVGTLSRILLCLELKGACREIGGRRFVSCTPRDSVC